NSPSKDQSVSKRFLWSIIKVALGIALLVYVVWSNWAPDSGQGLAHIWQKHIVEGEPIHAGYFVLAAAIYSASVLITFGRWYVLVRAQDLPFTLPDALRLGLIGFFLSNFLPAGSVGGDIIKAAFLAREQSRRTVAVATVLIDRAIGLWGLFWLVAILGIFFWAAGSPEIHNEPKLQWIVLGSVALVGVTLAVWLLLEILPEYRAVRFAGRLERIPKAGHSLAEFWRAIWMYRLRRGRILAALSLALVGHVGFVLTFYFAAQTFLPPSSVGQIPTLQEHYLLVPIGMTIQALFPSPGGMGGGEWGFGRMYALVDPQMEPNGVLGSLVQRVITWALGFIGYLVYLRMKPSLHTEETAAVDQ
ncbi:MAG TPA: lysylphosphatidylglycerol synthase transmembrane domain-containing protein, partial [Gemmataceae bacterium]|nr:lysylphosphatidylglycerol synthase transmembrane domain-containing protein [Gemmataceae bacterium]